MPATALDVRKQLVDALQLDLIGPNDGCNDPAGVPDEPIGNPAEVLPQAPSRWYLTGFLAPKEATAEPDDGDGEVGPDPAVLEQMEATEEFALRADNGGTDDATPPEPATARFRHFPSSIGLSVLIPPEMRKIDAIASWGDYEPEWEGGPQPGRMSLPDRWLRRARKEPVQIDIPQEPGKYEFNVPDSRDLKIVLAIRSVSQANGSSLPAGARALAAFLVNRRRPDPDITRDRGFIFQAKLALHAIESFVPRPDPRGINAEDWDDKVADLQYRDEYEFAVGHNTATRCETAGDRCHYAETCWIPQAEVERVTPAERPGVELRMEELAKLADAGAARAALQPMVEQYREWLEEQRAIASGLSGNRRTVAKELCNRIAVVADRIEAGIRLLTEPNVLEAFRLANAAIAKSARQRFGVMQNKAPKALDAPKWRPFQLAFLLMNLPGIAKPISSDRGIVDLLFFPTGGGKTEAYLGLSAFTILLRRLENPGIRGAGVSVLMRYTLRLLTLDQLGRAAGLICALETIREGRENQLGERPFEIGLWVGQAATPNWLGEKGDGDQESARSKTLKFKTGRTRNKPIPLDKCPWCGTKFERASFTLYPTEANPEELHVSCTNLDCEFGGGRPLPIVAVDESLYRRVPCFLIATVDKFASLPWVGESGQLFGKVERYNGKGFYGPMEPNRGELLPDRSLLPPDLVIQDELHLISGPLGTIVGLYEAAIDQLTARMIDGKEVRAKIVASTATVRRADKQIRALFNRTTVEVFPPPGPNRKDSFFAETQPASKEAPRLYTGITAQGRSPKVILLRVYLALLGAAQKAAAEAGGAKAADPYLTLVGYFNSLRELGGARRIVEDEVTSKLSKYADRRRKGEADGLFANRTLREPLELTSRVSTDDVSDAKRRMELEFGKKESVDVALATNMISVGLDIPRLGLMAVFGQPKTTAEYIQATSRVGREKDKPGLIVTILNIHKPRDRSHYERFETYHRSFYRTVEATSVTPYSPRALDRALAATLVAMARHAFKDLTPAAGAEKILDVRGKLDELIVALAKRAASVESFPIETYSEMESRIKARAADLADAWHKLAKEYRDVSTALQYNRWEDRGRQPLLRDFLDPELLGVLPDNPKMKFRANRSMRDVEMNVNLWMRTLENEEIEVAE